MEFEEQSEEMKFTILHASIGEVALEASALEYLSSLLLDLVTGEDTTDKKLTLGRILGKIRQNMSFIEREEQILAAALDARNTYAHRLPEIYIKHINYASNIRNLIEEMKGLKQEIAIATELINERVRKKCEDIDFSFDSVSKSAEEQYTLWKNA